MARIPIRVKLALASAAPLLGLLGFSAAEVRQATRDADRVRDETELASAATGPTGVITRLQDERSWAVVELSGLGELEGGIAVPVTGYDETRTASDRAIAAFRADVESIGDAVEATYGDAVDALAELDAIRRDIDHMPGPRSLANTSVAIGVYDRYASLIDGLLDATSQVTTQVRDADLRQGTRLADLASHQVELQADVLRLTAFAAVLSPNGIDTAEEIGGIVTSLSSFDLNNRAIQGATGRYAAVVDELYPRALADRIHTDVQGTLDDGTIDDFDAFLANAIPPPEGGYYALRDAFADTLTRRADTLHARATARQQLFTLLAAGAFILAAAATWLVSRSITRPLRSLTRQATDVARHRLPTALRGVLDAPPGRDLQVSAPAPVVVRTRDEVGDVASALNAVQASALTLAVEQAVLRRNVADAIVSLGRRNQRLLGRQLDFITMLAREENDAGTDASLFRLGHLATRMRRHAASLVVLAGVEAPRPWAAPVLLTRVVQAALVEVEGYERVRVDVVPAAITGAAATDLAHLLAELIENALAYSPPEAHVVVRGWWHDHATTLRLAVFDQGLGMNAQAIARANGHLRRSGSVVDAPSRYLGHQVAGRLAARHGFAVRLQAARPRGVTAVVDVPSALAVPTPPPVAEVDPATTSATR